MFLCILLPLFCLEDPSELFSPQPKLKQTKDILEDGEVIQEDKEENTNNNSRLKSLEKQLAIEMKVKHGAENMKAMLLAGEKSKKLIAEAEQMLEDSKTKIDAIKMSILREKQQEDMQKDSVVQSEPGVDTPDKVNNVKSSHEKKLEHRVDDIRRHIDIETRVAEGARNMLRHFLIAQDKKGIAEVSSLAPYFLLISYNAVVLLGPGIT